MIKTVLVTGASRGIGHLTAKRLAREGHTVFASMRDTRGRNKNVSEDLRQWSRDNDAQLYVIDLDVTDSDSVHGAVASIERDREIDVVVNNAGVMPVGVTEAFSEEQWRAVMEVNLYGIIRTTRAVLPYMRVRRRGRLIHLSSTAGRLAIPFFGVYCASKWAMEAFCETVHYELEEFEIDSTIVEPSGHATDLVNTSPRPSEIDRSRAYGGVSAGGDRLLKMFETMFAAGDQITDAQNVADKIAELVSLNGELPMRVCVGGDMGVDAINQQSSGPQSDLISTLKPVYQGT